MSLQNTSTQEIYLIKTNGAVLGPLAPAQIAQMISYGNLTALDEVKSPLGAWKFIREEPSLYEYIKTASAPQKNEKTQFSQTQELSSFSEQTPPPVRESRTISPTIRTSSQNQSLPMSLHPKSSTNWLRWGFAFVILGASVFIGFKLSQKPKVQTPIVEKTSPLLDLALEAFQKKQFDTANDLFKTQSLSKDPQYRIPYLALLFDKPYLTVGLQASIEESFDTPLTDQQRYELQLLKFKVLYRDQQFSAAQKVIQEMKGQSFQDWRLDFNQKLLSSFSEALPITLDKNVTSEWAFLWLRTAHAKDSRQLLDFLTEQSNKVEPGRLQFQVKLLLAWLEKKDFTKASQLWTALRDQVWPDEDRLLPLDVFLDNQLWQWSGDFFANCNQLTQKPGPSWLPALRAFCQYKSGQASEALLTLESFKDNQELMKESQSLKAFVLFKQGNLTDSYQGLESCSSLICSVLKVEKSLNLGATAEAKKALENWPSYPAAEAIKKSLWSRLGELNQ